MKTAPTSFPRQLLAAVLAGLVPVVLTAFLSIPFNLGRHPGEAPATEQPMLHHMP